MLRGLSFRVWWSHSIACALITATWSCLLKLTELQHLKTETKINEIGKPHAMSEAPSDNSQHTELSEDLIYTVMSLEFESRPQVE